MALHGADALVVNISETPGVVILEYEVQGNAVGSGNAGPFKQNCVKSRSCAQRVGL
jgi:hypothetical protein